MGIQENLLGRDASTYGADYNSHVLEIYKLYVQMADNISARRQTANSFFLTLNTAVVGFSGYALLGSSTSAHYYWILAVAGMILSYLWYRVVRSYKDINSGKFKVVHEIESLLPLRCYDAEWTALGRGQDPSLYLPFTDIETKVPWVFCGLHAFAFLASFGQFLLSIPTLADNLSKM